MLAVASAADGPRAWARDERATLQSDTVAIGAKESRSRSVQPRAQTAGGMLASCIGEGLSLSGFAFGSLFAGIGGLDLGLERAGMECKWQVENDDYATRVLAKHWPNVRRWDDITTFKPSGKKWAVDLICGGFPCQDISCAGKGAGLDGERSGLFFEAIRVVELLRPRWLLLENVAALLNRGLDKVLGTLATIGYDAEWHCLQAADFGAPHLRDRVFVIARNVADPEILGWGNGIPTNQRPPDRKSNTPRNGSEVLVYTNSKRRQQGKQASTTARYRSSIESTGSYAGATSTIRNRPTKCDWWAVEPELGRVAHGVPKRVDRLRGLGNAVVPQIAEWLGRQILDASRSEKVQGLTDNS